MVSFEAAHFLFPEKCAVRIKMKERKWEVGKVKCDYCGKYYDEEIMTALDNGSPACPNCVADEDAQKEKQRKEANK